MAGAQVEFLIQDAVAVDLEPISTFDKRVRAALAGRWPKVETVKCSNECYERMVRAGLMKDDDSPASYVGKTVFIDDEYQL